jgi:hypothetical protein
MNDNAELTAGIKREATGVPFTKDDPRINREGRPKGSYSLKVLIERKLRENPEIEAKLIADLLEKDQALIYQMIDGKPKQAMEMSGDLNITNDPEHRRTIEEAISQTID